jgi:DNA-binding MarR family transcriptional regulator
MRQDCVPDSFATMVAGRPTNLRQLLQAANRRLNTRIADSLRSRGFIEITATHTMLLSNMTLENDTVTSIARRASVSAQAVGRLVRELEEYGYLRTLVDKRDARSRLIALTAKGRKLMGTSFATLGDIEQELTSTLGTRAMDQLRRSLREIAAG